MSNLSLNAWWSYIIMTNFMKSPLSHKVEKSDENVKILYQFFTWGVALNYPILNSLECLECQLSMLPTWCNYDAKYVGWDDTCLVKIWSTPTGSAPTIAVIMTNFMTIAISIIIPGATQKKCWIARSDENLYCQDLILNRWCLNCCIFRGGDTFMKCLEC